MDNVAEALKFVSDLKDQNHAASEVVLDGRQYSRGSLSPVKNPEAPRLDVHTLTGLVDYLKANVDGYDPKTLLVHVVSPTSVVLRSAVFGAFKQREVIAVAEPIIPKFEFGRFMPSEDFIIGLNAMFTAHAAEVERLQESNAQLVKTLDIREAALRDLLDAMRSADPIQAANCRVLEYHQLKADYAALEARCAGMEGTLLELLDRIGEGIGHKFESWEMAAFLRELRAEIRAALADTTTNEVQP